MKSPALIVLSLLALSIVTLDPAERFPEYVPWLVPILAREKIVGPVTHVRDGDTIEVRGQAIRFGSLDCAELDTPAGQRAKTEMQRLVGGAYLVCRTDGRRSHDRWIGSCLLPDGKDLAGIMIARNICRRYW
jgi:endonuclease YncB( thermonuclease family)